MAFEVPSIMQNLVPKCNIDLRSFNIREIKHPFDKI